jgi:hypothetical protein
MKILDILSEDLSTQIARDSELIARAQRKRWEQEQAAKQAQPADTAPVPSAQPTPQSKPAPTPEQIASHPKYKEVYQRILKQVQAQSTLPNPKIDAERAKKFTDQRISKMIQSGQ